MQDFDRFFDMSKDPEVMTYIGDGSIFHWTKAVARTKFIKQLAAPTDDRLGVMAVYRQADSQYLGWCAISHSKFLDHIELGYRYCRDAWNRGYATEAAAALLWHTYQTMHLNRIMACVHPENAASIGVLKKLGFTYSYSKPSKPAGTDLLVYQIGRPALDSLDTAPFRSR